MRRKKVIGLALDLREEPCIHVCRLYRLQDTIFERAGGLEGFLELSELAAEGNRVHVHGAEEAERHHNNEGTEERGEPLARFERGQLVYRPSEKPEAEQHDRIAVR